MWTEDLNLVLTVFKIYPSSDLQSSIIRSLLFIEPSLHMKENVELSLEFASNHLQDVPFVKFRKFPDSFSYIY